LPVVVKYANAPTAATAPTTTRAAKVIPFLLLNRFIVYLLWKRSRTHGEQHEMPPPHAVGDARPFGRTLLKNRISNVGTLGC
jgi:hypothetical protein